MKKAQFLVLGVLSLALSTAWASQDDSTIDESAGTPMLTASFSLAGNKSVSGSFFGGANHYVCSDLASDSAVAAGGLSAIMEQEKSNRDQIEVHCSEIIRVAQSVVTADDSGEEENNHSDVGCSKSVEVVDLCVPRPFGQQALMSLAITCQNNPTETCIHLATQLDSVHPTIYKNK